MVFATPPATDMGRVDVEPPEQSGHAPSAERTREERAPQPAASSAPNRNAAGHHEVSARTPSPERSSLPIPPSPAELAVLVAAAGQPGGLDAAVACARAVLAAREAAGDPWAGHLGQLLGVIETRLARLPPLHDVPRLPIHYDDRVAHAFEQLVALLRTQDAQMAELRAIIAEIV